MIDNFFGRCIDFLVGMLLLITMVMGVCLLPFGVAITCILLVVEATLRAIIGPIYTLFTGKTIDWKPIITIKTLE